MNLISPVRRVQRIRHEQLRREVEVLCVESLGPRFISVTFKGEALADFASEGFDDHVKFIFADGSGEAAKRDYTPRRFDRERRELTIEFAVHGEGAACQWARQARPGMPAVIGGPKSSMIIPTDYAWHLLAGDFTALPAIHRRLEELPSQTQAFVLIQVVDSSERRELASAAQLDLKWLFPNDDLTSEVRALCLPESEGFAWAAGEAGSMARIRHMLLAEKGHPLEAMRVAAYWKKGEGSFHQTLA